MGIKQMVKKEIILDLSLGKDWEDFLHIERQNTVASLLNAAIMRGDHQREEEIKQLLEGSNTQVPELVRERYLHQKQDMPIKEIMQADLGKKIKWRLKVAYNTKGKPNNKCPCDWTTTITQKHILECDLYDRPIEYAALMNNQDKDILIKDITEM
jgi:hypothetical protein